MTNAVTQTSERGYGDVQAAERQSARPVYRPPTDVYETKDHIVVLADMPGVAPDALDITVEKRVLTIRGRAGDAEHPGYRRIYAEYGVGDFERAFTLSEDIDADGIEAELKDGLLRVTLPKAAPAKARRIDVKSA